METSVNYKPLGIKAYGSIPHLPTSRLGPGDHHVHQGQAKICTEKVRDKHDHVIVQAKYDGSCVAVAKLSGKLLPLTRSGLLASESSFPPHHLWYDWVIDNSYRFDAVLEEGERIVGEWLAQAHGTRYKCDCIFEPFVAFDIMREHKRMLFSDFVERIVCGTDWQAPVPFNTPTVLHYGPIKPEEAYKKDANPWRKDPAEGVIYRVERQGKVEFLAKWVHPEKEDGKYLFGEPVWNWRPNEVLS